MGEAPQFDVSDLYSQGTTMAAHEYGHILGYFIDKGITSQNDPLYAIYDNNKHAWKNDPKERLYIMSRATNLTLTGDVVNRRVMDFEFRRLNQGHGIRLGTNNSTVTIR